MEVIRAQSNRVTSNDLGWPLKVVSPAENFSTGALNIVVVKLALLTKII